MTLDEMVRSIIREELQASGIQVHNPVAQTQPPIPQTPMPPGPPATPSGMQAPAPQFPQAPTPPGPPVTPPGPPMGQPPAMPGPGAPQAPVPPAAGMPGVPGAPGAPVQAVPSLDDIKAKCNDLARANQENAPNIVAILAKHQATTLDQLQPASYPQVMSELQALGG